jgi:hypothetical protein
MKILSFLFSVLGASFIMIVGEDISFFLEFLRRELSKSFKVSPPNDRVVPFILKVGVS